MLLHALIKSLASILGIHWFIALVLNLNQWTPRTKYIWIWTNQSDKTHLQSCVFIGLLIAAVRISGVGWITCVRTWFIFLKIWNKQSHIEGITYWVFFINLNRTKSYAMDHEMTWIAWVKQDTGVSYLGAKYGYTKYYIDIDFKYHSHISTTYICFLFCILKTT